MFGDGRGQNDLAKYALEGSKCMAIDSCSPNGRLCDGRFASFCLV